MRRGGFRVRRRLRRDRSASILREARAGVEAGRHLDDGVAGFGVAIENGPLDRGGAAILGQERAVEVDAAEAGGGERFGAEDFAVVADDEEIGGERGEAGLGFGEVDGFGGPDLEAELLGRPLKRARLRVASARWAGDDEHHFVRRRGERFERRHCERAGA